MALTIAAPPTGASSVAASKDRCTNLRALPLTWRQALLAVDGRKRPIHPLTGRELTNWPSAPAPSFQELVSAPAVGLRTGPISSTLCLDFDGPEAWQTFVEVFGGRPDEILPKTISWTSSKPYRQQRAFHVPEHLWSLLEGRRRKIGTLEIRWKGAQSVLIGAHPETSGYRWCNGRGPLETELAELPEEFLNQIPTVGSVRKISNNQCQAGGFKVPLEQFITLWTRQKIERGSVAGECNSDAMRISMDLLGAEMWLKVKGVRTDRSAEDLFEDYLDRCPETINGRAFDRRAMHVRFNGAAARNPIPPTPEEKLLERLAFHKRMATRGL